MGELIDLAAVGRASRPLARLWEKLLEHGHADLLELERARRALDQVAPQPGRLGRAVALVVGAGLDAPEADVVSAVELLCLTPEADTWPHLLSASHANYGRVKSATSRLFLISVEQPSLRSSWPRRMNDSTVR